MTEQTTLARPTGAGGADQVLVAVYAVFAVAAGARSAVQLATRADEAPLAYTLSLVAALTYVVGWVAIRRAARGHTRLASLVLWVELVGVLTVGTASVFEEEWFADATVWSEYGSGYGYVPLVLPVAGLLWLRARVSGFGLVMAFRVVAVAEALTWVGLLAGMYAKYVADAGERGVQVFGPIHGCVFLLYVLLALLTWRQQRWSPFVGVLALAAAFPPFGTLVFELVAARTGRLAVSGRRAP